MAVQPIRSLIAMLMPALAPGPSELCAFYVKLLSMCSLPKVGLGSEYQEQRHSRLERLDFYILFYFSKSLESNSVYSC